ncbi:MAG: aminoglycoside phosphotransferase family protein [Chloroflexi bacterium]|nr:aminoglycoside phosphotransferase family protein [Chloroflexota bacterium]
MNSQSKTPVSFEAVEKVVAKHLGTSQKITTFEELKDGAFNAAYYLKLEDGFQCVLKVAPKPENPILRYEKDIMLAEVDTMRLIKIHTEMPVPGIIFFDNSHSILPSSYFGMDFIDGTPLNKLREKLTQAEQSKIDQSCGRYLHQMNSITGKQFGPFAHPEEAGANWSAVFGKMLDNVMQDSLDAGVNLPISRSTINQIILQHTSTLDEVKVPSLIHWDLWDGNIFINPESNTINGIIDFERALWADPLMEVNFETARNNIAFLKGYGFDLPFTPSQQVRRTLYNLYLFLIMIIECSYRGYSTDDQEIWARKKLAEEMIKLGY